MGTGKNQGKSGGGGGGGPGDGPNNSPNSSEHGDDTPVVPTKQKVFQMMQSFLGSINKLGNSISGIQQPDSSDSGKAKVKDPNVFDGTGPRKLKPFLITLSLVFVDRPKYFTKQKKINYALSYLSGSTREWFEPDILDPNMLNMPAWTKFFPAFVWELTNNFGLCDAQGEAKDSLGILTMKDSEVVRKYNMKFNTLAAVTDWNDNALWWAYGRGLAPHIKDEMARISEPRTLAEYQKEVLQINARYWK